MTRGLTALGAGEGWGGAGPWGSWLWAGEGAGEPFPPFLGSRGKEALVLLSFPFFQTPS